MAAKIPHQEEIMAALDTAEADGAAMTKFVESVKGTELKVSVQGLRNWVGKNKGTTGHPALPRSANVRTSSKTGANLLADFEAQERDARDKGLLNFLEDAEDLEAQLAAAQSELRRHKGTMGLIRPSVEV